MSVKLNVLVLYFCLAGSAMANEIKLCYEDATVFPWITGEQQGLVFTELKMIEKKLNIKFNFIRYPWKRCQLEAQSGKIDGLIAASYTRERAQWGIYPTKKNGDLDPEYRFHTDSFYVYVRKDSKIDFENNQFKNLGDNQIGVQLGYSVGNDLLDMGYPIHSAFANAIDLLRQLDMGALNVAVLQNHETMRTLKANPHLHKNIKRINQPFKVKDQYLLMTKLFYAENEKLVKSIWKALSEARKSAVYKAAENDLLSITSP